MSMKTVRRVASSLLKKGESKIRINPGAAQQAKEALTRDDVRRLIKEKGVTALRKKGVSRGKARRREEKKKTKGSRTAGKRRGKKTAIVSRKRAWINKVRAQRKYISQLKAQEKFKENSDYRKIYRMVKGGSFRSKGHIELYLKDRKMLKE